jgi:subtilisin family serine protease
VALGAFAVAAGVGDQAHARTSVVGSAFVAPEVRSALQTAPNTRVIVSLADAPETLRTLNDRAARRRRVADAQDRVLAALSAGDFHVTRRYDGVAAFAGSVSASGLARLASRRDVVAVTPDEKGMGALAQSVPLIRADQVQTSLGYTGSGETVAVLDSGADTDHPDLAGAITTQECFLTGGGCPLGGGTRASGAGAAEDDNGHGTNVTGIVTSDGVVASRGVAPGAQIAAYKVLNSSNSGFFSDWIAALSDIISNHPEVDVVNMSLVSFATFSGNCDSYLPAATTAITTLRNSGVLSFVSSGNNAAKAATTFPSCVSNAVSVGAVWDQATSPINIFGCTDTPVADKVTCWSNSDTTLDLLAPGALITSSGLGGGTSTYLGTSQAAPHASGLAALMLQANPGLSANDIESRMKATGVPRTDAANGRVTPPHRCARRDRR